VGGFRWGGRLPVIVFPFEFAGLRTHISDGEDKKTR